METLRTFFTHSVVPFLNAKGFSEKEKKSSGLDFSHLLYQGYLAPSNENQKQKEDLFRLHLHRFAQSHYHLSSEAGLMLKMSQAAQCTEGKAFSKDPCVRVKCLQMGLTRGHYRIMVGSAGYEATRQLIFKKIRVGHELNVII